MVELGRVVGDDGRRDATGGPRWVRDVERQCSPGREGEGRALALALALVCFAACSSSLIFSSFLGETATASSRRIRYKNTLPPYSFLQGPVTRKESLLPRHNNNDDDDACIAQITHLYLVARGQRLANVAKMELVFDRCWLRVMGQDVGVEKKLLRCAARPRIPL